MTYGELHTNIKSTLKIAGIEAYEFETNCILKDIMNITIADMLIKRELEVDKALAIRVEEIALKRVGGYPLQYLLGEWEFYGLPFKVGDGVLIPRPDTEILVDTVLSYFKKTGKNNPEIVDLCSGSGCVAIALKKFLPSASVYAVELSGDVMPYLAENIRINNADVKIIRGDVSDGRLLDNFCDPESIGDYRQVDCIVSNPPYLTTDEMEELQKEVTFEPEIALRGGIDGLKFYRIISCLWREILASGGLIAFEIGYKQSDAISKLLEASGYHDINIIKDLGGNDRVVTAEKI